MRYEGPRSQQLAWIQSRLAKHGPDGVTKYVDEKNRTSIDALPGIQAGLARN